MRSLTVRRVARTTVSMAVAAAGIGVAAGCGDDDKKSDKSAAKPATFAIQATAEGKKPKLTFPSTVEAGLVTMTLKSSDTKPRSAGILRIVGDYGIDDVLKVIDSEEDGGPIPAFMEDGGGTGTVAPGKTATVTQNLAPGKYAIWDDEGGDEGAPSNSELGAKGEFTVTGEAKDDELPPVPATVTATDKGEKDYGFAYKGLKAGPNQVRFENTGEQLHHALFFPYNKGATLAEVKKFVSEGGSGGPPPGPPPFDFKKGVGTTVIDGGIAQNVELDLPAGKYAVLCFIQDRKGGKPHVAKGMLDEVEIK